MEDVQEEIVLSRHTVRYGDTQMRMDVSSVGGPLTGRRSPRTQWDCELVTRLVIKGEKCPKL